MSRGLRFPSVDAMPESMRSAAARALESRPRAGEPKVRKPRRDDEHNEQVVFFNRLRSLAVNDPRYADAVDSTFAIPNGGGRSKREAGRLKAEGVRAGVSDIFVALPVSGRAGLWIEMKSLTGKPSREQSDWITSRISLGYEGAITRGADEAMKVWRAYVGQENIRG